MKFITLLSAGLLLASSAQAFDRTDLCGQLSKLALRSAQLQRTGEGLVQTIQQIVPPDEEDSMQRFIAGVVLVGYGTAMMGGDPTEMATEFYYSCMGEHS